MELLHWIIFLTDLAPGNDEIYEERQETFLTAGNPQDGQVVLYKVSQTNPSFWCEGQSLLQTRRDRSLTLLSQHRLSNHHRKWCQTKYRLAAWRCFCWSFYRLLRLTDSLSPDTLLAKLEDSVRTPDMTLLRNNILHCQTKFSVITCRMKTPKVGVKWNLHGWSCVNINND